MNKDIRKRVLRVLAESPFIESHNDTPIQLRERSDNDHNQHADGEPDVTDRQTNDTAGPKELCRLFSCRLRPDRFLAPIQPTQHLVERRLGGLSSHSKDANRSRSRWRERSSGYG